MAAILAKTRRRGKRCSQLSYVVFEAVITLHHLNQSRSQRVLWLLEELELPYEIVKYQRDPATLLGPKTLEAIHPLGKSPVIVDGEHAVAESGAILEHLVDAHGAGRLAPQRGTPAHRDYRYFMHYAEGSLMPFLTMKLVMNRVKTAPLPFFVKPIAKQIAGKVLGTYIDPNLARHVAFLAQHLADRAWFAGDELSAADIQMSYPIEALVTRGGELGIPPRLADFVKQCRARPAYQRALTKGGEPLVS